VAALYKHVQCPIQNGDTLLLAQVTVVGEIQDSKAAKALHENLEDFRSTEADDSYAVSAAKFAELRRQLEEIVSAYDLHIAIQDSDESVWHASYLNVRPEMNDNEELPSDLVKDIGAVKKRRGPIRRFYGRGELTEEQKWDVLYRTTLMRTDSPAKAAEVLERMKLKAAEARQAHSPTPHPQEQFAAHMAKEFAANQAAHGRERAVATYTQRVNAILTTEAEKADLFQAVLDQVAG
jgi:hypothetical protein